MMSCFENQAAPTVTGELDLRGATPAARARDPSLAECGQRGALDQWASGSENAGLKCISHCIV